MNFTLKLFIKKGEKKINKRSNFNAGGSPKAFSFFSFPFSIPLQEIYTISILKQTTRMRGPKAKHYMYAM